MAFNLARVHLSTARIVHWLRKKLRIVLNSFAAASRINYRIRQERRGLLQARRIQARQGAHGQGSMGQLTVSVYEEIIVLVALRFEIVTDEACKKGVASRC